MRTIGSAILAATMIVTSAYAATDSVGPLAPGKPAGVKTAQSSDNTLWWVLGAGVVIGGIALVASGSSKGTVTGSLGGGSTTTSSSSSSGTSP